MRLWHGDCLELMQEIPDKSIDMVLTDPPYGTTACKWDTVIPFEPMWNELNRIIKDNGAICLFGSEPFSSHLRMSNIKMFKYDWFWYKNYQTGMALAKYQPMRSIEIISIFYRKTSNYYPQKMKARHGRKPTKSNGGKTRKEIDNITGIKQPKKPNSLNEMVNPRNVLEFKCPPRSKGYLHPTQKPVALLEYLIKTYTLENETVLDFTMGSGSTGVACKNLNRKFIGIEKDDKYFEIANKRINDL